MSELAAQLRANRKAKLASFLRDPKGPVDASSFTESEAENGGVQTGPRPVSRRQFKRGGNVVSGTYTSIRADRKRRASGGMTADQYQNRDAKEANEKRDGTKHVGGMKKGGRPHRKSGGNVGAVEAVHKHETGMHPGKPKTKFSAGGVTSGGTRPMGGRLARKVGGRTKKGSQTVNIIIAPSGGGAKPPMPMAPPGGLPAGPMAPPPGAGMPPPPMGARPPIGAPPPARASGGRIKNAGIAYPIKDGAGGAKGRLQKIKAYGA